MTWYLSSDCVRTRYRRPVCCLLHVSTAFEKAKIQYRVQLSHVCKIFITCNGMHVIALRDSLVVSWIDRQRGYMFKCRHLSQGFVCPCARWPTQLQTEYPDKRQFECETAKKRAGHLPAWNI